MNVMFFNAQGLTRKVGELNDLLTEDDIDIACISETHFTTNSPDFAFQNYTSIRNDRDTHLGGLLTLMKTSINFKELDLGKTKLLEYTALSIEGKSRFIILNVYLPGGARPPKIRAHLEKDLQHLLLKYDVPLLLMGDLNAKHTTWNNRKSNTAGTILHNFVSNHNFTVLCPPNATYVPPTAKKTPSTIDLLVVNNKVNVSRPWTKTVLNSDHVPVFFKHYMGHSSAPKTDIKPVPNFNRMNWQKYRDIITTAYLPTLQIPEESITSSTIDESVEFLTATIKGAIKNCLPLEKQSKALTFLSSEVKAAITKRNYHRRRWLRSHQDYDKDQIKLLNNYIKWTIKEETKAKFDRQLSKCKVGDNSIFKIIKASKRTPLPTIKSEDSGQRMFKDADKAIALAKHFAKMHENPLANNDPIFSLGVATFVRKSLKEMKGLPVTNTITSREVANTIRALKKGKAPGPDEIPVTAIQNLPHLGIEFLTRILNNSLKIGHFPSLWKIACTVPVHKPGKDPGKVNSYRPIALLNILAKVFERIINSMITVHNHTNKIIPDYQFGFKKKHSPSMALRYLTKNISTALIQTESVAVISFDAEKAFDRVWHDGLIYKMLKFKFPHTLIQITNSFLRDRKFFVRVGSERSNLHNAPWGVPQGSALSPSLYNIYIADIPNGADTRVSLFADDTMLESNGRLVKKVTNNITKAAEKVVEYYTKWKIKINTDKTVLVWFSNRKSKQIPTLPLIINNTKIEWKDELKYLGVILDKKLTLKAHINNTMHKVVNKMRQLAPYIGPNSPISVSLKLHLFRTYIRPIFTYAAPITFGAAKTNLQVLNRKYNGCLRSILNVHWESHTSNSDLLKSANLESLEEHMARLVSRFVNSCNNSENPIVSSLF